MISYNSFGKNFIQIRSNKLHGINPRVFYKNPGKSFDLARFSSLEMREAGAMNRIALKDSGTSYDKSFKNASYEDSLILKDSSPEGSSSRVRWVNPKDNKVYFLLKDGDSNDSVQNIRILDSSGRFIKRAALLNKKTIIIFELESDRRFQNLNNVTHSDLTSLFVRRFNPFANIKVCLFNDDFDVDNKLLKLIDKNVSAISCAFSSNVLVNKQSKLKKLYYKIFHKKNKINPKELSDKLFNLLNNNEKNFMMCRQMSEYLWLKVIMVLIHIMHTCH